MGKFLGLLDVWPSVVQIMLEEGPYRQRLAGRLAMLMKLDSSNKILEACVCCVPGAATAQA